MRKIPKKLLDKILADDYYKICARKNGDCLGRITFDHCWIYAGKQINERWAIIPVCVRHHLGDKFVKEINQMISLNRATDEELSKYPRKNWAQLKKYLNERWGKTRS